MATDKKGFILYADQRSIIDMLDDETAGKLLKHIFSYVNDEQPKSDNMFLNLAFEPIKLQLKRDLKHWELIRTKRSEAGKASAIKRQQVLTSVERVEQNSTNPTVIVKDNVKVTVKDTVTVKDINKGGNKFSKPSIHEIESYCLERSNLVDWDKFYNHYESNGWMVGKNKMKDWKACVRTWEKSPYNKKETNKVEQIISAHKQAGVLLGIVENESTDNTGK